MRRTAKTVGVEIALRSISVGLAASPNLIRVSLLRNDSRFSSTTSVEIVVQDFGEATLSRDCGEIFSILTPCCSGV